MIEFGQLLADLPTLKNGGATKVDNVIPLSIAIFFAKGEAITLSLETINFGVKLSFFISSIFEASFIFF